MSAVIIPPPVPGAGAIRRRSIATLKSLHSHAVLLLELYRRAQLLHGGVGYLELGCLLERHCIEQATLAQLLSGRARTLGDPVQPQARSVVDESRLGSVRWDKETMDGALRRLLEVHGLVLSNTEPMVRQAIFDGNEIDEWIVTEFVRSNERQRWLVAEHLVMR